ncbi:hypothetical protein [Cereibacter johrii]|uniref:Uncharacterized protein n=1 Tax=Cereibacter johrii TaxID=445629 RepID=A0ABX5J8H4_9RHOB|nr:hypothetical protein [Cereibacter johrii]PTM78387.1 hypothetical protein C8J29_104346 [Cereibacter johrii]
MRLACVSDGVVVNVIEAQDRPDWAADWPKAGDAAPGWTWDCTSFAPPAETASVPDEISILQVMILVGEERWSAAEAVAADPALPWALRATIRQAGSPLVRGSETMDALAWLLDLTPEEVEGIFAAGTQVLA